MGTTGNIFVLHSLSTHFVNTHVVVDSSLVLFVDFSKAFDYLVRNNLWNLELYGVCIVVQNRL